MASFEMPGGWSVQAFRFALDPTAEQAACVRRQFGGRRYARNWAVRTLKEDLARYRQTGEQTAKPSLPGLRKRWNQAKDTECVDRQTGEVWWPEISKEAFADGIKAGVEAYWNWQQSRAGQRAGRRVGFPRFAKKGRDRDRVTFTTGALRVEPDRRHITLPRIGTVRVHQNTHRLQRLLAKGRARILAATAEGTQPHRCRTTPRRGAGEMSTYAHSLATVSITRPAGRPGPAPPGGPGTPACGRRYGWRRYPRRPRG
jgi:putative transposase